MRPPPHDGMMGKLTERAELTVAARFLLDHGVEQDEIAVRLCRHYYIDIDELNDVVESLTAAHAVNKQIDQIRFPVPASNR